MTEAYAIKPCPCCGWNARFEEVPEGQQNSGGIYIECTNKLCRLSTNLMFPLMDDVRPELAQKWNRRVPVTVSEKGEAPANELAQSDHPTAEPALSAGQIAIITPSDSEVMNDTRLVIAASYLASLCDMALSSLTARDEGIEAEALLREATDALDNLAEMANMSVYDKLIRQLRAHLSRKEQ